MHQQRIPAANERCTIAHACLGRAVEDLRIARGLTRHELARQTHVQPCYIQALEAGRINPPFHFLLSLIHSLGVTMPELFARHQRHHETYPGRPEEDRRRSVNAGELLTALDAAPSVDADRLRSDLDALVDQDPTPRG